MTLQKSTTPRRVKAALSGVAVAVGLTGALMLPTVVEMPSAEFIDLQPVTVSSGTRTLVCPAAAQTATADSASAVTHDLDLGVGAESIESSTTLIHVLPGSGERTSGVIGEEPVAVPPVFSTDAESTPRVGSFPAAGGEHPSVGGVTIGTEAEGDLRALVAGGCIAPASSSWLVGGNTEIGSSTQLILTNPGETPARVKVQAWTGVGPVGGDVVALVEPGASSVVLTETIERADRIAFHVTSEGGAVAAYLLTTTLDGIVPRGVSYVTPSAVPGLESFVGPLRLAESTDPEWATDLRILNPGDEPAQVSVSLLGPSGEEPLGGAEDLIVEAGMVARVAVAAPEAADYTVRILSDQPVTTSISTAAMGEPSSDLGGTPIDISWLPSAHPAAEVVLVSGPGATFAVTNPAPQEVAIQVEQIGRDGEVAASGWFEVDAGATTLLEREDEAVGLRVSGAVILASAQYYRSVNGPLIAHVPGLAASGGDREIAVVAGN